MYKTTAAASGEFFKFEIMIKIVEGAPTSLPASSCERRTTIFEFTSLVATVDQQTISIPLSCKQRQIHDASHAFCCASHAALRPRLTWLHPIAAGERDSGCPGPKFELGEGADSPADHTSVIDTNDMWYACCKLLKAVDLS